MLLAAAPRPGMTPESAVPAPRFQDFTAWALFTDAGLLCALLLAGQVLRARIPLLQRLRIPAALLGGMLALLLGPNGLKVLPFSPQIVSYPAILVVMVFAAVPIRPRPAGRPAFGREVGEMLSCVSFGVLAQYGWGMLLGLFLLGSFWPLHPGFGYILGTSWWGGPGTTAAAASAFKAYGWEDALSLGMASSMAGAVAAIVVGIAMVHWRARKRPRPEGPEPGEEAGARTGLIPEKDRKPMGFETVSSSSIESLAFHLSLVMVAGLAGAAGNTLFKGWWPSVDIPAFALALVAGYLLQGATRITRTDTYVDAGTIGRISGACVDFLIVAGIGAIQVSRVVQYAAPLGLLLLFGLVLCLGQALILGPRMFKENWFEKSILIYGLNTGTLPQGIMLLRIVDPRMESRSLDSYAIVDLLLKPLTIGLVVAGPPLIAKGYAIHFAVVCSVLALAPLAASRALGCWYKGGKA